MVATSKTKLYVKENEEDDWSLRSALPVAMTDVDLEGPPTTGEEYLRMVRMESNSRPSVFISKTKPPATTHSPIPKTPREAEIRKDSTEDRIPSSEWREAFRSRFINLRKIFEHQRKNFKKKPQPNGVDGLPYFKDETAWRNLLYGNPSETEAMLPYSSILFALDQKTTLTLLEYHIDWLEEDSITKNQAQWLFALLLRVDKLLTSDSISTLRELCRQWGSIRSNLTHGINEQIASLNMLISIVVDYFGQLDLWDEINAS